ncbi:MOSC N-terminal beta barrel domain-containing protein [Streptomyces sp. NPDC127037]|uniref:MOSC N-terminal beta barrel domain-containing protein n=1 Tax=Streptomyces sp. NPDC127037 TaxID=3347113 RepID=UPI00364DDE58
MTIEVGVIARIWRYPIKSTGGERRHRAEVEARGLAADRLFATHRASSARGRTHVDSAGCRACCTCVPVEERRFRPNLLVRTPAGARHGRVARTGAGRRSPCSAPGSAEGRPRT